MTDNTPSRMNVGTLMRRPDPAELLRTGDLELLTAKKGTGQAGHATRPAKPAQEPANRRVGLSLTASQEGALKEKAGDVPLSRWVVRYLERQRIIPAATANRKS